MNEDRQRQSDEQTNLDGWINPSNHGEHDVVSPEIGDDPVATAINWRMALSESMQVIAPALVLAMIVHFFLAQATVVYGQSMEPNLYQHQRLVVDKISFRMHPPQRGDIVVLDLPEMEEMLVKRVVGLPGERVEILNGVVYINGEPLPEPFPHDLTAYDMPELALPPLNYFVLGDNRGNSNDSRAFGGIHRDHIVGRVWLRYWPINQMTVF
jgi:signal peptidase I